jgi:hypothetical protein
MDAKARAAARREVPDMERRRCVCSWLILATHAIDFDPQRFA